MRDNAVATQSKRWGSSSERSHTEVSLFSARLLRVLGTPVSNSLAPVGIRPDAVVDRGGSRTSGAMSQTPSTRFCPGTI